MNQVLRAGTAAPDFTGHVTPDRTLSLSELRDKLSKHFASFLLVLVLLPTKLRAEETFQPPAFKTMRDEEDYSYLRDSSLKTELLDELKFIRLNSDGSVYLTLGGEIRERYEYFHNNLWGGDVPDHNGYLLQRYMLHTDLHIGEHFRIFAQIKSGLESGRNGGPRPSDRDTLDLHQLFFDYKFNLAMDRVITLRLGRQELAYGSSRLISVRESPNVRQSFDGIKAIFKTPSFQLDAFAVKAVETKPGFFDDAPDPERKLWGLYSVTPVWFLPGGNIDLYYIGLERQKAEFDQGIERELRHSLGTRIWGKKSGWDYNFECVYQLGRFGDGQIHAWTAASDTGYTFEHARFKPRIGLKADITSGDRNPNTRDLETFSPLFPRGAYFSETALIGPANHIDLHPSLDLHLAKSLTATLDWDVFWRESTRDGIYGNAVNLVRSGQTSNSRYVGNQAQLSLEWNVNRHTKVNAAIAHFFAGDFLNESGPGMDTNYASLWVTYRF